MSTFNIGVSCHRASTTSKLDQSDNAFQCDADHTVVVGVEDSVPETSKLDQKDDYVAPVVEAEDEDDDDDEENSEEDA